MPKTTQPAFCKPPLIKTSPKTPAPVLFLSLVLAALIFVPFSYKASAGNNADFAQLNATLRINYGSSNLGNPANKTMISEASAFVAALTNEVQEQIKRYSDPNSTESQKVKRFSNMRVQILEQNMICEKALTHFTPMLEQTTATIEHAAQFWYGSQHCMNQSTATFIRTQQKSAMAYGRVQQFINDLAGGLHPGRPSQLPKDTIAALRELSNETIMQPAKTQALALEEKPKPVPAAAAAPKSVEQFYPSVDLLNPIPTAYDETTVRLVARYLKEIDEDLRKREPRAKMTSVCSMLYNTDPAKLIANNGFFAQIGACSAIKLGLAGNPKTSPYYQQAIEHFQAFKKGYKPTLP